MATSIQEQKFDLNQLSERRLATAYPQDLVIVSEGDSWFNYPLKKDVIDQLIDNGYAIKNFASAGDTLENMIYGTNYKTSGSKITHEGPISLQLTLSAIKKLKPKFFLFSAGGNDVVGAELIQYLNHKNSKPTKLVNETIFKAKLAVLKKTLEFLIKSVAKISKDCHMLMDGYDYAKVTGKGYKFIGIKLAGPWIQPAMGAKAITNPKDHDKIIKVLIDGFNGILKELDAKHDNFHFIDLRGKFPHINSWDNEIHLKASGYEKVANLYKERMHDILTFNPVEKFADRIIV